MEFKDLRQIVRYGEGQHTEFKLKTYYPHKIIREVIAFANTSGGKLIIGVADDGQIPGLKHPDEDVYVMQKAIEKLCSHPIEYKIHRISLPHDEEKEVVVFDIEESVRKPIYSVADPQNRKAYIRAADRSIQASREMCRVLAGKTGTRPVIIRYGDSERQLLQYLGTKNKIDSNTFSKIASISKKLAEDILVRLAVANVLVIKPQEGRDDYYEQAATDAY